jgi:hypothetical protein
VASNIYNIDPYYYLTVLRLDSPLTLWSLTLTSGWPLIDPDVKKAYDLICDYDAPFVSARLWSMKSEFTHHPRMTILCLSLLLTRISVRYFRLFPFRFLAVRTISVSVPALATVSVLHIYLCLVWFTYTCTRSSLVLLLLST